MLQGYSPVAQALLGTLFTWALTALGSGLVFVFKSGQRKILDGSLGFAAGVMTAASYWSLLAPAIEFAEHSGLYGQNGEWAFIPVAVGFVLGAIFVYAADIVLPNMGGNPSDLAHSLDVETKLEKDGNLNYSPPPAFDQGYDDNFSKSPAGTRQRRPVPTNSYYQAASNHESIDLSVSEKHLTESRNTSWRRILLLIVAITVHNIPEGLAVGVGFGAIGKTKTATFENARNLAFGIGIQNFPEGLAVSLPLRGSGMSVFKSFWYGQLSGMVEPIAGLFGAAAVVVAEPLLPYALAFAAGAMIYVVVDDIVPEAQTCGNGKLASWGAILGFVVMMSLDVGLG
ncbi:zinc transporter ZIP11-like [Haliotis cracherodii]|uniref:zinc transporter ZIP11-like n=1 Tax=Haliotis cracherodii TaxID=6455 RepID=UPI0039E858F6